MISTGVWLLIISANSESYIVIIILFIMRILYLSKD
nr:MAG TPA: hypothetical protein [Bacteriophage sp.]